MNTNVPINVADVDQATTADPVDRKASLRSWWRPRLGAAGTHVLLSMLVVAASFALLLTRWYPGALLYAGGGVKLLTMIAVVDVVIGPLLTFAVFDRRKKSLRLDLAFIVLLQLGALAYGLHASYQGRPVFQVFATDRFEIMSAADVDPEEFKRLDVKLGQPSGREPTLVAVTAPSDPALKRELVLASAGGADMKFFLRYYVAYASQREAVLAAAKPVGDLIQFNSPEAIQAAMQSVDSAITALPGLSYLPLQGKREDLTVLIHPTTAEPLAVLRLAPWSNAPRK
jgi:hypothetical protein